jgi:hypothetical protein
MRTSLLALGAALALGIAGGAFADQPANGGQTSNQTSANATPPKKATDPLDQTVCRHEQATGTRIPGPATCRTRREWAEMAARAHQTVDSAQTTGFFITPPGPTP